MKTREILLFMFIFCLIGQKIYGEDLTLEKAVEIALQNNSDWKIAQKNKENTFLQKRKNQSSLFPSFNLGSNYSRTDAGSIGVISPQDNYSNSISLTQNIFNRKLNLLINQTDLSIEQTRYIDYQVRHAIILAVKTAYYNVLGLQSKLDFYKDTFARDEEQLKYSQNLLEQGKAIKTDILRAEITLEGTRQNLNTTQNDLRSAKMILNNLLNIPLEKDFQFTSKESIDDGTKKILAEHFALEEYAERAKKNNYQLKVKDYDMNISKANIDIARTGYLPVIGGSGSLGWSDDKPQFNNREWRVGVNLSWTVFDAGLTKTSIRQAEINKNRTEEEYMKLEKQIILNVQKIYNDLENLRNSLEISRKNLELATENYDIVKVQYQNGLVSSLNLIDAEVVYTQSKLNLLDAYYNYKVKLAEWEDAIGEEI
ncbi:MAG: TolC family protein [bacterium]|nr:TolC family protein [bacterium]